jgi:Cytochrome c554 and c-prime
VSRPWYHLLLASLVLALVPHAHPAAGDVAASPGPITPAEEAFLERHWRMPIAPQGDAPATFSPIERSLAPADCGTCHAAQYQDWRDSIHARSLGPGVAGQLVEMARRDPAGARGCLVCHAPLAEQSPLIRGAAGLETNPGFDASLQRHGVVCASCHVRQHQRFGPPPRPDAPRSGTPRAALPHNGATHASAYLRAEFCAACHQFGPSGIQLNGKPLENTYAEWRDSPAARRGLQCQNCHMPDRRHRWRGIHDAAMVKSGVRVSLALDRTRYRTGQPLRARVTVASVRVGHYFPTYVTPQVVVRALLVGPDGAPVEGTTEERVIGRQVPLDLSREIADTRIPPGGRFVLRYGRPLDRAGLTLRVTVTVYPDHFYTGFFAALLETGAGDGEALIREALEATRRSPFEIFARDVPLT